MFQLIVFARLQRAVNKARSVSGEAKPLLERKSSEFCASRSGGSPLGLETGPRSENTGENILSDLGDGSGMPGFTSSLCVGNC